MNQSGAQQTNLCSKKVKGNDGRNFLFFSPNFFSLGQGRRSDPFVFPFLSYPEGFLLLLLMGPWYRRERERKKVDPARVASRVLQLRQKLEGG